MSEAQSLKVQQSKLPGHICIPEPLLRFHPEREEDVHEHPLRGLEKFGPYSRAVFGSVVDPIRIATIGPKEGDSVVESTLRELEGRHVPRERAAYLIDYPGFSSIFGIRVLRSTVPSIALPEPDIDKRKPFLDLIEPLTRAISAMTSRRSEFDVLVIYLPIRWERCFFGEDVQGRFNLHHFIKCHAASLGIPTQIIREDKALTYRDRCSVMWRLGIALYSKSGGIPWTLANMQQDTMYVGLGYAVNFDEAGQPIFLTACSQVFEADGTGFEFLGYGTKNIIVEQRDNVFLNRSDMYRVVARSLDLYQHRHAGRPPGSVIVHKSTPFKEDEVAGCFDALSGIESVELLQIKQDTSWRGVHLDPPQIAKKHVKSVPGYAMLRGTCLLVDKFEALLWTQGNVPQPGGRDFFKEMKGTARPLGVKRFAGHGPMSATCRSILALTKMDWNNDALYNRLPVTLEFAGSLARIVKNMPDLSARPYSIRLFM